MSEPADVIMTTWCPTEDHVKRGKDFYYGQLPDSLQNRGISYIMLCMCEEKLTGAVLKRNHIRSVPQWLLVPVWAPLLIACDQIITSSLIWVLSKLERNTRIATLSGYAWRACMMPSTNFYAMYFHIARRAVRGLRTKVFVMFYEGAPYEKVSWLGAKAAPLSCLQAS